MKKKKEQKGPILKRKVVVKKVLKKQQPVTFVVEKPKVDIPVGSKFFKEEFEEEKKLFFA